MLALLLAFTLSTAPSAPPAKCRPALEITGKTVLGPSGSDMGQYKYVMTARPGCKTQLVRIITRNGGKVPPLGFWRIGGGYPLRLSYWVMRGGSAEWKSPTGAWVQIPQEVKK